MRLLGWVISSIFILFVALTLAAIGAVVYFSRDLPDYTQLINYEPPVTTRLHAADGRLLAEYATEHRVFVPIEAIPDTVIQAFVAAEDQHFFEHGGLDFLGIARAMVENIRNLGTGRRLIGASTITQQVAKNFLLSNEVSWSRKIREALLAIRIEHTLSKNRILELYLNEIYLGRGSYGVAAAALNYFNRSLPELTLGQAAFLAALPKAPNNYNPARDPEAAVARRNYVLQRMLEDGRITAEQAERAMAEPLAVANPSDAADRVHADYFAEEVRRQVQRTYGEDALYRGGLSVRTTLDPRLQTLADRALRNGLIAYDRRHGWRGPVAHLDSFDNWPERLAAVPVPAGAGDWQLAVVLEVGDRSAEIGLGDRQRGEIAMAEMSWARPWLEHQRIGPEPRRASQVLHQGDVVLVEALPGTAASAAGPAQRRNRTGTAAAPAAPAAGGDTPAPRRRYALRQIPDVQGAIVVMDPHTGRVLAVSGGYSYAMSEFNRATQAQRQPGSAFKPFVYLSALLHGYTPSTILLDLPLAIEQGPGMGLWRPSNYSNDFLGPLPLRRGVELSRNLMTVRLLMELGLQPVHDIARDFGIYPDMPLYFSMALGAGETTPLQLTAAYAMIANGGRRITPTFIDRIQDRHGATIYRHDQRQCQGCSGTAWSGQGTPQPTDNREQVVDAVSAYQMTSILEGVVQRGTATQLARLHLPLAGKTGTTNDSFDAWFVGFTPDLVAGVFVGFDNPRTLGHETGSTAAVPIFGEFMEAATAGQEVPPFRIPPGVVLARVDPRTGVPASPGDPGSIWEAFRPGTEPGSGTSYGDPNSLTSFGERMPEATAGTGGLY